MPDFERHKNPKEAMGIDCYHNPIKIQTLYNFADKVGFWDIYAGHVSDILRDIEKEKGLANLHIKEVGGSKIIRLDSLRGKYIIWNHWSDKVFFRIPDK